MYQENEFDLSPSVVLNKLRSLYTEDQLQQIKQKSKDQRSQLIQKLKEREKKKIVAENEGLKS